MRVSDQPSQQIHREIQTRRVRPCTTMPRMLDLRAVLQLIVDRLNSETASVTITDPTSRSSSPFMFLRTPVISSTPRSNSFSNNAFEMWPLSPNSLPNSALLNKTGLFGSGTGLRSSLLPGVRQAAINSPCSLTIRCSLNPKNQAHPWWPSLLVRGRLSGRW